MEAPDFWDNAEVSQQKMKELKSMKDDMEIYHSLETQMEDMETMIEMGYEENDPEIIPEIQEMLDEFQKNFDSIRVKTLLSGEYDSENAIIKLNAGAGGTEACDWCGMLYRMYSRWVDRKGFTMEVLDYLDGDEAGVKSVTFQVNGENAYGYLKSEKGVHRLVRISPFNAAGGVFSCMYLFPRKEMITSATELVVTVCSSCISGALNTSLWISTSWIPSASTRTHLSSRHTRLCPQG